MFFNKIDVYCIFLLWINVLSTRVSPAPVGIGPRVIPSLDWVDRFPRACGDRPEAPGGNPVLTAFPPRLWG